MDPVNKILITGARGFIGSVLCRKLLASGVEVHAVSRQPSSQVRDWWRASAEGVDPGADAASVQWWTADLAELEAVKTLYRAVRPDATLHLASQVTGSRSMEFVVPVLQNNLLTAL